MKYFLYSFSGCGTHFFRDVVFKNHELNHDRHRKSPLAFSPDTFEIPKDKMDLLKEAAKSRGKNWLEERIQKKRDIWRVRSRPIEIAPDSKGIYLFGNPYNALMSLFRRGQNSDSFVSTVCRNLCVECPKKFIDKKFTLDDYLEIGYDLFELENHFNNWYENLPKNFMMVKYDELPQSLNKISEFVGLPIKRNQFKKRQSDYKTLPDKTKIKLEIILGSLFKKIQDFPSVWIKSV